MDHLQLLKKQQCDFFKSMAGILGAMASPSRIRLIHFLSQAPLTVEVLANKTDYSVANTSMHLRKMLNEDLVNVERIGQKRLYALEAPLLEFWEACQDFIQRIDPSLKIGTQEMYGEINWKVDWPETRKLIKKKKVILLDVRPNDEVLGELKEFSEILQIAQHDLKKNFSKLPKRKIILVFCRGRACNISALAVNYLNENGLKSYRLEDSWTRLKNKLFK